MKNSKSTRTNTGLKGISERKSGKFEANVRLPMNRTGEQYKSHIGTFDNLSDATTARITFIKSLL